MFEFRSHKLLTALALLVAFGAGMATHRGIEIRRAAGGGIAPVAKGPEAAPAGATDGLAVARPGLEPTVGGAAGPDPSDRPGKWRRARESGPATGRSAAQQPAVEPSQLTAVPYLQGYRRAGSELGVTIADPRAAPGLNLVTSGHDAVAVLMDVEGKIRHRWRSSLRRVWPDLPDHPRLHKLEYWRRALLLEDGSLLAIFEINGLIKLDRDSRLIWAYRSDVHHDLFVAPDRTIWVLDRRGRLEPRLDPKEPILDDLVTVLSPEGEVLRQISILDAFERSAFSAMILNRPVKTGDIFHTNTLERLDGSLEHLHPAFREGNLLISVLQLNTVAVLDPRTETIVWVLQGMFRKQHQPSLLPNGHLLLFDNLGAGGERSRILEIDPVAQRVVWSYGGTPEVDFFSRTLGTCQRLDGGNTLITESENGRAFEITPAGEIVWEYHNPQRAGDDDELVASLFEVLRLPADFPFQGSEP